MSTTRIRVVTKTAASLRYMSDRCTAGVSAVMSEGGTISAPLPASAATFTGGGLAAARGGGVLKSSSEPWDPPVGRPASTLSESKAPPGTPGTPSRSPEGPSPGLPGPVADAELCLTSCLLTSLTIMRRCWSVHPRMRTMPFSRGSRRRSSCKCRSTPTTLCHPMPHDMTHSPSSVISSSTILLWKGRRFVMEESGASGSCLTRLSGPDMLHRPCRARGSERLLQQVTIGTTVLEIPTC